MFTKKVTDDDKFMSLSSSAQALYLHLSMSADDDGFTNQVAISMFKAHASTQDLESLLQKRYVYQFENGVMVIRDWRMANALRKDRYTPTIFQNELAQLKLEVSGAYTLDDGIPINADNQQIELDSGIDDERLPDGCQMVAKWLPQDSIGKDNKEKNSKTLGQSHPKDVEDFFNKIWNLYPKKKGKGQVSSSKKLVLYKLGYDVVSRCIDRYVNDFNNTGKDMQYMMYGSTFFNSGYVDYLDENYETEPETIDEVCRDAYVNARQ